jgi:DNA-binding transcriptional LysR family regulator
MMRFTLRQLEYATTTAEVGSVAAAAAKLGVAQPSVSSAIMKLEDQIGMQIFVRQHAHGVTPSPQGQRFLAEARSLLLHATDVQRMSALEGDRVAGVINVGCFLTLAPVFAPRLIAGFQSQYPDAQVRLEEGVQEQLLAGLREGRIDTAILYRVDLPGDIRAVDVASFAPHVLLPANHKLAKRAKVSLKALQDENLVLLDVQPSRTYFTRILAQAGVVATPFFASPSIELVRGMVGQGLGYSLLITRPAGDRAYDGSELAVRPIVEDVELGVVSVASLKGMRMTRSTTAFESYCITSFKSFGKKP